MCATLDDLISLVKERGTQDTFPDKEELHGLLEPFRALPDQESLRLALAAKVRKGDRLVARVASEALAYLGGKEAGPLLIAIITDESLGTSQRAAAAWAMEHHIPAFREQLTPEEQFACVSIPIFEMLEDPEADDGFGLESLLDSYTNFPPSIRIHFISAIAQAARDRGLKMASLCMHLLGAEVDSERQEKLLEMAAADNTQEAADLLATFVAKTSDGAMAKHARRHLHKMRAKGLRGTIRSDMRDARAMVTGSDGDACFAVNLIIPRLPTFDFISLLFHLRQGLRDGFAVRNLPSRNIDEMLEKIKQGCGSIACFVPMPLAARIVDEAMAASSSKSKMDSELTEALAMAEPALAQARAEPFSEPALPTDADTTGEEVCKLLDTNEFESWFFEVNEATVQTSLKSAFKPTRGKNKLSEKKVEERLMRATEDLYQRLRADNEHLRLQQMLRHQARLFECCDRKEEAALCRKLSMEVERPVSMFLGQMAARAILDAAQTPPDAARAQRFLEGRDAIRSRLIRSERNQKKSDAARLDIAAVAHVELNIHNREAPSAQRAPLSMIEEVALAIGEAFIDTVLNDEPAPQLENTVMQLLGKHELFPEKARADIAAELSVSILEFIQGVCHGMCPYRCFEELDGDGRNAFYATNAPWGDPEGVTHQRGKDVS
jgi:hypothetical protein